MTIVAVSYTFKGSETSLLKNGLNKEIIKQKSKVDNEKGFYVTEDIGMAKGYADFRGKSKPGVVLKMHDEDIGDLLQGDGTKYNEAYIPFKDFDQVKPEMIDIEVPK